MKISPALTCLPGLAAGWLYVKELEMWFQQGICVAILRKNGSVTLPRKMRGSINEQLMNRSQCPFCGWGILLGSYPLVRSPGVPPGTLSVGTLRSRGTDDTRERHGPGWEAGRLTYIPDDESVGPFRPLPPASHGGEGPVIEAVGIPGARTQETEEGIEQGANPFCPGALSYCSSSCGLSYSQQEGAMRGLQVQALAPG